MAEVESQQASDDYLLTQQENNLALAEIALAEAMNYPADRPLRIVTDPGIETPAGVAPFDEVLGNALENNPKAVAARHDVRHSRLQFSIARGNLFPSLYVGGGYSTNFFMSLDDRSLYASFPNQFRDNRGFYVSAQLNIPIFGGLARRTSVSRARNNWRIAEQNRTETLRALQSEARWRRPTSRCWATARSSSRPRRRATPRGWPTRPLRASTSAAWSRLSTCRRRPTSCFRPAPSGCAPDCNISSRCGSWPITTASR